MEGTYMSETVEATGRTLDEAKRAAAAALGVSVEQCEFEVVESGAKGLFAKSNFKVRASVSNAAPVAEQTDHAAVQVEISEPHPPHEEAAEDVAAEGASEEGAVADATATEEDGAIAAEMVQGVFDSAAIEVTAEVGSLTGRYVNIRLTGPDTGLFVSSRNPALDSLQYLCNAMFGRLRPRGVRITLDAKEYRQKRTEALEQLAQQVAEQVVSRKQEAVLDALPAHERRIVHRTLAAIEGIETYSEGEEPNRRVVISPKSE
ncbi:MAG: RNA-binding cell elongation regulator Jag/EloR [Fimbriimonadales bacterium]